MVILAIDLEKVDFERGIDEVVGNLIQTCRRMGVPLVFAFNRNRLGCLVKHKGQKVSCVGICNFLGANDIFNKLVELTSEIREEFYTILVRSMSIVDLLRLRKENPFLNWEHPKLVSAINN